MPFTPKGIFYFLCDVFYGLLSFILFVIGAKASVAQPKRSDALLFICLFYSFYSFLFTTSIFYK
ncbi:MAG: hypothetical protein CMC74_08250 [Flavobacteriaceae bacterium]|nr:hypothetical protein [Flavobacteriaceae bacterium]